MSWPIHGLPVAYTGPHTLSIGAGQCKDSSDTRVLLVRPGASVGIDAGHTGAGGLDTGELAPSTAYGVWLARRNDGRLYGLISESFDAHTVAFAEGTVAVRRLGTVLTDAEADLVPFGQGGGGERCTRWRSAQASRVVVDTGSTDDTGDTGDVADWAAVDLTALVSPRAHTVHLQLWPEGGPVELGEGPEGPATLCTRSALEVTVWRGDGLVYRLPEGGSVTIVVAGFSESV